MKKFFCYAFIIGLCTPAIAKLSANSFPETVADLSFKSRVEIATEGYKPFLDRKAYQELNIVPGEEIYTDRMIAKIEAEDEQQIKDEETMTLDKYCEKYPDDETKCQKKGTPTEPVPEPESKHSAGTQKVLTEPIINIIKSAGQTIGGGVVVENNYVTGGSCYPAARVHSGLSNKIETTGRYEKISPAFEKALITIFRKEGTCGRIKNDPCGYTCYGIGSDKKCAGVIVRSIAEAEDWYYKNYWLKYNIGQLPDVISPDYFLAAMASGQGTAHNQFCDFLGIKRNKKIDSTIINAVNNYDGDIHNKWIDKRDVFLQDVARRRYHGSVSRGYKNSIDLKRKNGCHVRPSEPLYR